MEIVVGKMSGFCFGVNNAVKSTEKVLKKQEITYCLGEIVHNRQVIEKLENQGLRIIEDINEVKEKSKLIIRAHGIPKQIYKKIKEKKIKMFDFTCPRVTTLHESVSKKQKDHYIFILGDKTHPETVGTRGFCDNDAYVIQEESDINTAIDQLKNSDKKKIYIVAQTTFSVKKFKDFTEEIAKKASEYEIEINNSICASTRLRQEEVERISKEVQYMIIIGGKNSSNTQKLYNIAKENCLSVYIQTKDDLDLEEISNYERIGISAGASTPRESIEEIVKLLEGIEDEHSKRMERV